MDVAHEQDGSRGAFFVTRDGVRAGELQYFREDDGTVVIAHTEVSPSLRGTGAGKRLVEAAVAWARRDELRIVSRCAFASSVFDRDPALCDVLAR